jgi:hypothetical protein
MITIRIEYRDGDVEKIENATLLNGDEDGITEYQIDTPEGIKHIPLSIVKTLTEEG